MAGDDIITSTVRMLNMNGTDFIYKPTEEQLMEMPLELRNKIVSYDKLYFSYKDEYEKIVSDIYEATNKINYYTHTMMPTIEQSEITAQSEADKLTAINLSPLGLSSVTTSTSQATVESALKNYAKVYVKTGYVKIEINSSNYKYVGTDSSGWNYGTWTGNFKVTNYSDSEDIAYSEIISVKVYDNYQDFIEQKILKNVANNSDEEDSVFDVLSIDELSDFKQALKLYCLNRLTSFYDAIQSALDVLIEVDQASESADLYEPLYMPYYDKLQACQNEIDSRQATIDEWQNTYDNLVLRQQEIQADLNFQDYLGEELYKIFCMYKREDTYQNDNYISDGLSDSEIIQKAKDFLEVAQKELEKARTPNHSISSTLHNLLIMPEFKPIIDNFKLGNWLRICVDGIVYRLRLIGYELSFSSLQTLSVEFSNITKLNTIANETKNILDSAKSMASNFDYFVAQAKRGNEANVEITHWLEDGLQSALVNIKNNNNEEITFDKHGLWAKTYNSETGNYDPEMFRLTHNILAYTTDGFKTVKAALGKHNYYKFDESGKLVQDIAYGIRCDFVAAGYIYGSQIISGDIYSENYSSTTGSHINLKTGAFTLGSGKIVYNPTTNKMEVKGVNIEWSSSTTPEISDIDGLSNYLDQLDGRIQTYSQATDPSKGWTTTEKSEHIGDLWFDTTNSLTKRWNGSSWDIITDSELKELAQSKAQIFTTTPTIPYYVGDLWVQGSSGDIMNCIKTRTSGSYTASDWVKSSKYTDDTKANEALEAANKAQLSADNAKSVAENAETIGNNLVNVLGYDGTKITGTYIYSPVISGGTILVGDKNGTYAEITTEGVLNCVGANVSGTFYSSSGSIAGWKITSSRLQKEDTSSGLYVALCSPTEVGGVGNGIADVLVVRTGTSSSGYQNPVVLSSNGDIVANSLKSSNAQITGGSFKIKTTADTTSYISLTGNYSGTEFFAGGMKHTTGNTELTVGVTADGGEPFVQVRENYAYDNTICSEGIYINKITSTTSTNIVSINARGVYTDSDLFAEGDLAVFGKKSRIATTDDYGMRSLYCYETPTPTFGDIGEGQIDDTGKCYIFLDDIFAETIDTKCTYQVFLQTYGKGECYVTERTSSYFIVEGTENLSFGWEVKAVQKEYDTMRLEEYEGDKQDEDTSSILNDTYNYLDSLLYDVESEEF